MLLFYHFRLIQFFASLFQTRTIDFMGVGCAAASVVIPEPMDVSTVVAATCDVDVELVLPPPAPIEPDIPDFVLHPNVGIIPKTGHSVLNSSFAPKDIAIAVAKWGESPKRLIREMGLGGLLHVDHFTHFS